jgi:hypothetical protein
VAKNGAKSRPTDTVDQAERSVEERMDGVRNDIDEDTLSQHSDYNTLPQHSDYETLSQHGLHEDDEDSSTTPGYMDGAIIARVWE